MYPVMLEATHDNTRDNLLSIKEQLRQIPEKGIGYGVLKYIRREEKLQGKDPWDLVFNYLGQSDNIIHKSEWLSGAEESGGQSISDNIFSNALIEVNSIISGGSLQMNWSYSRSHYSEDDISALSSAYFACLDELITHCREQEEHAAYAIPSDYGLSGDVSYEELNSFLSGVERGVERRRLLSGVYRLSPLQEGLLFHGLYDETGGAYIEQFRCEVGALDDTAFAGSWSYLLRQHSILRSSFYADVFNIPVQGVHRNCELPILRLDYRGRSEEEQQDLITAYLQTDREAGFDFRNAPLMRVMLIQLEEDRYQLIWTSHHLILDGWSVPILMEEFLQAYDDLMDGKELIHYAEDRYEDYIRYIGNKDKSASVSYWRDFLRQVTTGCLLPFVREEERRTKGIGTYKELLLLLNRSVTGDVNAFCRKHHITVNTLMQGVWSYLLYRYTGSRGITYGVTVSGRPEDLPGMERKIGLYINTLLFHTDVSADADLLEWLLALQESQSQSRLYQYASLAEIQRWSGVGGTLFDTMITFQNYPVSKVIDAREWKLKVDKVFAQEQTNYLLSLLIGASDQISVRFNYNEDLLGTGYVEQISRQFEKVLLAMISQEKQQIKQLDIQDADLFHKTWLPKKEMLFDFE
jgi:non-ribosomal peptide synthase protein (TIGR01720 family)